MFVRKNLELDPERIVVNSGATNEGWKFCVGCKQASVKLAVWPPAWIGTVAPKMPRVVPGDSQRSGGPSESPDDAIAGAAHSAM